VAPESGTFVPGDGGTTGRWWIRGFGMEIVYTKRRDEITTPGLRSALTWTATPT